MIDNDSNVFNYDISKLKNNLNRILDEKGITTTELAKKIGSHQSRVSNALNISKSDCFTVPQLVSIAELLGVSVDDLLGIKPAENKNCESLSNVIEKLFEINDITPIKMGDFEVELNEIPFSDSDVELTKRIKCIFFENDKIEDVLKTWDELNNCSFATNNTKKEIIGMWKNKTLDDTKQFLKKWNFRNEIEEGKYLADETLASLSSLDPFDDSRYLYMTPLTNDERRILKNYVDTKAWLEYSQHDIDLLTEYLEEQERI